MGVIKEYYNYIELPVVGNEIVDTTTGESFDISNSVLLKKISREEFSVNYSSFNYINNDKLRDLIAIGIKDVDLALILCMSLNLVQGQNICLAENGKPHSTASIAKMINQREQPVKIKLNRLIKLGLLYYGAIKQVGYNRKVYVVNPNFLKKGQIFNIFLNGLFDGSTNVVGKPSEILYEYNSYFHIDTSALGKLIRSGIRQVDLALFIFMSCNLEQDYNICLDKNNKPHTSNSLSRLTKSSQQSVKEKLNLLVEKDLLHYRVLEKKKGYGKVYIANFHLVKGTRIFKTIIKLLFDDF
ncbi:hypothetical protein [Polaribacter tangerinus]|uniref:hypothetical protein n=1 Tax=Polaribacter tangerinus TaxID=1920034 RepID=UPI000B4AB20A|nr:hypothetical protein [Polaribacter tangerinus]